MWLSVRGLDQYLHLLNEITWRSYVVEGALEMLEIDYKKRMDHAETKSAPIQSIGIRSAATSGDALHLAANPQPAAEMPHVSEMVRATISVFEGIRCMQPHGRSMASKYAGQAAAPHDISP